MVRCPLCNVYVTATSTYCQKYHNHIEICKKNYDLQLQNERLKVDLKHHQRHHQQHKELIKEQVQEVSTGVKKMKAEIESLREEKNKLQMRKIKQEQQLKESLRQQEKMAKRLEDKVEKVQYVVMKPATFEWPKPQPTPSIINNYTTVNIINYGTINLTQKYPQNNFSKKVIVQASTVDLKQIDTPEKFNEFLEFIQRQDDEMIAKCICNEEGIKNKSYGYALLADASAIVHNRLVEVDPKNEVVEVAKGFIEDCKPEISDVD